MKLTPNIVKHHAARRILGDCSLSYPECGTGNGPWNILCGEPSTLAPWVVLGAIVKVNVVVKKNFLEMFLTICSLPLLQVLSPVKRISLMNGEGRYKDDSSPMRSHCPAPKSIFQNNSCSINTPEIVLGDMKPHTGRRKGILFTRSHIQGP